MPQPVEFNLSTSAVATALMDALDLDEDAMTPTSPEASTTPYAAVTIVPDEVEVMQPWSVDTYADTLMDELFEDVDRILDGEVPTSNEPVTVPSDYAGLQTIPKRILSPIIAPRQDLAPQHWSQAGELDALTALQTRRPLSQSFDKLLLAIAGASVAITAAFWLGNQYGFKQWLTASQSTSAVSPVTVPTLSPQAQADQEFINYIQRSLEVLDQSKTAGSHTMPSLPNAPLATNLPTIPVPGNPLPAPPNGLLAGAANQQPVRETIRERVIYVPFQGYAGLLNGVNGIPSVPGSPPGLASILPNGTATAPNPTAAAPGMAASTTIAAAPTSLHTLVGVLELGDRSASLFDINGSTQRISVGEKIGGSGWTLVKISSQEVLIRRNGEVRSIYIGQKF